MKKSFLVFVTLLGLVPCFAQQERQQRNNTPVPDCGQPISFPIALEPVSQSICTGSSVTFTAACANDGHGWEMSTDNGITWTSSIPNASSTSGGYVDTLTVFSVTPQMSGYQFRCYYRGWCNGKSITTTATLTVVNTSISILSQPVNISTCKYTSADFTISVSGSSLSYQWQQSTNGGSSFTSIPGKTTAVLHYDSVGLNMNNNQYRCVISSDCSPSAISDPAQLTVQNESTEIVVSPVDQTICLGSTGSLTVAASGNGVTYQWQNYDGYYTDIAGATSPTLIIPYGFFPSPEYRCKISSSCKTIYTGIARILYVDQPSVVTLADNYGCSGDEISIPSFQYSAMPGTQYHFQWEQSADGGAHFTNITGDTLAYKTFIVSAQANNYKYRCYLTSTCFTGYSDTMTLFVDVPVSITAQPNNTSGCIGHEAYFSVKAAGSIARYQWQRSTDGGTSFTDLTYGGTGMWAPDLMQNYLSAAQNNNLYRCKIISNCFDTVFSNPVTLQIFSDPVAPNDTSIDVTCDSCRTNIAGLFNTAAYASATWSGDPANAGLGKYQLKVFNSSGCFDAVNAYVNIREADTLKICRNSAVRFHCDISGSSYQWQVKGADGFYDIADASGLTGTATADVSFLYTGTMQIRCKVDNTTYSNTIFVKVAAIWNGNADSDWNNPLNWSCGEVPYYNDTEVIIMDNTAHIPEVRTNAGCKRLILKPGATIIIKPGVDMFISGN